MEPRPGRAVTNGEVPDRAPLRRMGAIPVVVLLEWDDGQQERRAAIAVRWTATHVMVTWREDARALRTTRYEWMRAHDVVRTVTWGEDAPILTR